MYHRKGCPPIAMKARQGFQESPHALSREARARFVCPRPGGRWARTRAGEGFRREEFRAAVSVAHQGPRDRTREMP